MDRALFLPRDWVEDRERCRQAGVPEAVTHRPKTVLARKMLLRTLDSGVPEFDRWKVKPLISLEIRCQQLALQA